jgi:hypothetical protein
MTAGMPVELQGRVQARRHEIIPLPGSATIAAVLHPVDNGLEPEARFGGNAYEPERPGVPSTLRLSRN